MRPIVAFAKFRRSFLPVLGSAHFAFIILEYFFRRAGVQPVFFCSCLWNFAHRARCALAMRFRAAALSVRPEGGPANISDVAASSSYPDFAGLPR